MFKFSVVFFESLNTCIGDMHSEAHTVLDRNVRFCGTSLTAHPTSVTNQGFVDYDERQDTRT